MRTVGNQQRRLTNLTVGSRGDVQPYVALGVGLQAAGYNVTIVTSARFAAFITAAGLRHTPVRADFLRLVEWAVRSLAD